MQTCFGKLMTSSCRNMSALKKFVFYVQFIISIVLLVVLIVTEFTCESTVFSIGISKVNGTSSMFTKLLSAPTEYSSISSAVKLRKAVSFSSKSAGKVWQTVVLERIVKPFLRMNRKHHDGPPRNSPMFVIMIIFDPASLTSFTIMKSQACLPHCTLLIFFFKKNTNFLPIFFWKIHR